MINREINVISKVISSTKYVLFLAPRYINGENVEAFKGYIQA